MQPGISLANPAAGHPLRRMFPAAEALGAPRPQRSRADDARLFAMTFAAGFVIFYGMIV